jgi:hypothetical protein
VRRYDEIPTVWEQFIPQNDVVRLTSHDHSVPLPSPVLLGVHATVAKVLHASGLAEVINEIMEEKEGIGCLASDGTTDIERLLLIRSEPHYSAPSQYLESPSGPSDLDPSEVARICV